MESWYNQCQTLEKEIKYIKKKKTYKKHYIGWENCASKQIKSHEILKIYNRQTNAERTHLK